MSSVPPASQLRPYRPPAISVLDYTCVTACGSGREALGQALRNGNSALRPNNFTHFPLTTYIGQVDAAGDPVLPEALRHFDCRNNRLAWLALQADGFAASARAAIERFGSHRVGLALGTSTSSIGETEAAYRLRDEQGRLPEDHAERPDVHTPHSLGLFVQEVLGSRGPCITVSTACSSSAKVFAVAQRWLQLGLVDAVVVGGVDSLCESVLHGFNALQLVSGDPCMPFDTNRNGINLGEAGGFALLGREPAEISLLGCGESSDAHHMSSPHPEGLGVARAVKQALEAAGMTGREIQYLNLHGTASQKNDAVEAILVEQCYGADLHASSTKGWTAHTLGAAGIVEASVCLYSLQSGFLPGTLQSNEIDPVCSKQIRLEPDERSISVAATHSFGFGGSNCVLIFGTEGAGRAGGAQ